MLLIFLHPGFTGIDQAYEAPESPELTVHAGQNTIDDCVQQVISLLQDKVCLKSPTFEITYMYMDNIRQ